MVSVSKQLSGCLHESIRLGLQVAAAASFDFGSVVRQVLGEFGEESINLVTHLGCGAKAGIGGDAFTNPVPDGFVGVEIGAVARQWHQAVQIVDASTTELLSRLSLRSFDALYR